MVGVFRVVVIEMDKVNRSGKPTQNKAKGLIVKLKQNEMTVNHTFIFLTGILYFLIR